MEGWQERILRERDELRERVKKLNAFAVADNAAFSVLPLAERALLVRQLHHMSQYYAVLEARIARWS